MCFFVDDNFIVNKKYLKSQLLPALIKWRKKKEAITFFTQVSMNIADDDELLQLMVKAGFYKVFIGIETPDDLSLTECNKHINTNRNLISDIKYCQQQGLEVEGGFIVGFDNDTISIFQKQIDFIQDSGIVTAMIGMLQALPGSKLFERLKNEKRLFTTSTGDNADGTTNIIPKMGLKILQNEYKNIMKHIYSPKFFYQRIKTFLLEYKKPKTKLSFKFGSIIVFFRSIFYLGILGRERIFYWKLIVWTICFRPRSFPTAITYAIYGHHFRRVCERHIQ